MNITLNRSMNMSSFTTIRFLQHGVDRLSARSVVFDIADSFSDSSFMGVRSIEFYKDDVLIENTSPTADSTSDLGALYVPEFAFNTTLSKIGAPENTSWFSASGDTTNQRLFVVFDTATEFDTIVVNNCHQSGGVSERGVKNVKITTSDSAVTDTAYNGAIPNGVVLSDTEWLQHPNTNVEFDVIEYTEIPEPDVGVVAKSVVLDIADNWGHASYLGLRRVEFKLQGEVQQVVSTNFDSYQTTTLSDPSYAAVVVFDILGSKIGGSPQWLSANGSNTNQRLIVVFNRDIRFDEIVINNFHESGGTTTAGAKNVKISYSTDSISDVTYNAAITNGTELNNTEWAIHAASNTVQDLTVWTA